MPTAVNKPRLAFIDLAKGICIMLVVWHHVASTWGLDSYPLKNALASFRMPLYFFLSGLFFKSYEGFGGFCLRKVNKLLIPFGFFFVTTSCLLPFILASLNWRSSPGSSVWLAFFWEQKFPNIPIWFLLALFWANLIFYGLYLVSKRGPQRWGSWVLVGLSLVLAALGLCFGKLGIRSPMFIDPALVSLPYFCAGHLAFRHTKLLEVHRWDRWNVPVAAACFGAVCLLAAAPVSYVDNHFELPVWQAYACGLLGTLSVLLLAKTLGRLPLVSYFGRYSIMILVTHGWVLWAIIKILRENQIHWSRPTSLAFVFGVTMLLYLGIIPLMKKVMPHVTAQKDVFPVGKSS